MGWLTRGWVITIETDPIWTLLSVIGLLLLVAGPLIVTNLIWLRRSRRARRTTIDFSRLIDGLLTGVMVVRPGGPRGPIVLLTNQRALDLWPELELHASLPAPLARLLDASDRLTSTTIVGPDGTQLAISAQPFDGRHGTELLLLLEDITDRRQEADIASALVRHVSHEMKTPLSVIRGHASRFASVERADPSEMRHAWTVVDDEATRLTELIDQAILMARFERADPEPLAHTRPVNLQAIAEDVVIDLASRAAEIGAELDLEVADGGFIVRGDRAALRQMLLNLVDNAMKYGGSGVAITIRLDAASEPQRLQLAVSDNGSGIVPSELPLVFEKGFRGSAQRGSRAGSGLGLALVRSIVEWHGGSISVESRSGGPTTFVIDLPRSGDANPNGASQETRQMAVRASVELEVEEQPR